MAERTTLVSVDLDDLGCYHGIHGLRGTAPRLALTRWLPRFVALFHALGVKATFFVIGRDLEDDVAGDGTGAEQLRAALRAGHELASHSYGHAYDLSRWSPDAIAADLRRADGLLRSLGAEPCGFRAPGYTQSSALMQEVAALSYRYDSSVLPSLPYYLAKVSVIAAMTARGRRSDSIATGLRSFLGPGAPYRRADAALVELPMSVTPRLRVPLIGTTLLSAPAALRTRLERVADRLRHFHLELHAIDLADADADGIAAPLVARQPELRASLADKRARLATLLGRRGPTTLLRDAAAHVQG